MITHKFVLPSGVECEVTALTGYHQRLLTQGTTTPHYQRVNMLLASILTRVGSTVLATLDETSRQDFVEKMLSVDRTYALLTARQYSFDFPTELELPVKYTDPDTGREYEFTHVVSLPDGNFPYEPIAEPLTDYPFTNVFEFTLPKTGVKARCGQLTGRGERMLALKKKADISSHDVILARVAQYEKDGNWLDATAGWLDKLPFADIEIFRKEFKKREGLVHREVSVPHPKDGTPLVLDVTQQTSFFFPTGGI